jgi:hypothetical protein
MNSKSPKEQPLLELINRIHFGCFELCGDAFGKYLPVAGNVGVFCQSDNDFDRYAAIRKQLTEPDDNPDRKYFRLLQPIVIPAKGDVPETTYDYLYVRKPATNTPEAGDVDFVLSAIDYQQLKSRLLAGEIINGASVYDQPGLDMVELRDAKIDALAYISTPETAEEVRFRIHTS